jgi:hypothetical protein
LPCRLLRLKSFKEKVMEKGRQEAVVNTLQRKRTTAAIPPAASGDPASPLTKMDRWKQLKTEKADQGTIAEARRAFQRRLPAGRRPRTPDDDVGTNRSKGSKGSKPPSEAGEL